MHHRRVRHRRGNRRCRYPRVGQFPRPGDRPDRRAGYSNHRVHRRGRPDPMWGVRPGQCRGAAASCRDSDGGRQRRLAVEYQVRRDAMGRRRARYRAEAHLVAARRARCRRPQTGCCRPGDRAVEPRAVAHLTECCPQRETSARRSLGGLAAPRPSGSAPRPRGAQPAVRAPALGASRFVGRAGSVSQPGAAARAERPPAGAGPPEVRPSMRHSSQTRRAR